MLKLTCSTLCFTQNPLDEALRRIGHLGFRYVDLGVQRWAHLSAAELVHSGQDIAASLQRGLAQANVSLSTMNVGLERDAIVSLAEQTAAVCALAASHELTAICINAPANGTSLESGIRELRHLAAVAARYQVTLCLETHINCLTEIPDTALDLVAAAPNVGLALDPSHFYAGPWQGRDISATYPHTRIVHLRDAGNSPDKILVPPGEGCVDFSAILRGLAQVGYTGPLSVEYIDTRVTRDAYDDHVGHVRTMASLAERLLTGLQTPYT